MSYTIVQEVGSDTSLIVQDAPLAPTIVEILTAGPQGPIGATGSGLAIDSTVTTKPIYLHPVLPVNLSWWLTPGYFTRG